MDSLYTYESPSMSQNSPMINYRKDAKKGVKFTFMVVGELGTGKTTFVNSLLNKKVLSYRYESSSSSRARPTVGNTKTLSFTSAKSVALPNTGILTKHEFDPLAVSEEPGIALTETKVEMIDDENMKLLLNIIDTPGFGENLNNELCFVEIENYLKQQFDLVLAEETRIKRNPRFVDTRVHVLLYFITPTGHGLREIDIQCMKRLSKYVNIIPVIGKSDSFTESELKHFKAQIKIDIKKFNVPIFQFDNYLNEYDEEEDQELIQECKFLAALQPFAIISSEDEFEVRTKSGETKRIKGRQYPWGLVDINDPRYSDFPILKSVILGSHLQDLKDLTHDFLYETYRTERLTRVTANSSHGKAEEEQEEYEDDSEFHDTVEHASAHTKHYNETVPSMSNLAQLTNSSTELFSSHQSTTNGHANKEDDDETASLTSGSSSLHKSRSMLLEDDNSNEMPSPKLKDSPSFSSSTSTLSLENHHQTHPTYNKSDYHAPPRNLNPNNTAFKRLSIGPQRNQLRQISETVPYVIRHERILERQQKLEEMEMASAKELATRAALLEQKAAALKIKERNLMKRVELERQRKLSMNQEAGSEVEPEEQSLDGESVKTIGKDEEVTSVESQ